jgi:hypothetical protein
VYRDRPRTFNELRTTITTYIRNISQADLQKVSANKINLYATGFKWLQSNFVYDIIFTRHLNFSTWFTKKKIFIIPGIKKDLIMD